MITNIPTADDLKESAIALLNMAWETGIGIFRTLEQTAVADWDDDGSVRKAFHASRQPALRYALVMVYQAQELGLKAAIAKVSPYLLLAGEARLWPAKSNLKPTAFEEFRTVDASDLVRVHDTVCAQPVDSNFARLFEDGRRNRNKIVHLGGHGIVSDSRDLLLLILRTAGALFPERRWADYRFEYELNDGYAIAGVQDVGMGLLSEFALLQHVLEPRHIRNYFGYDRRRRSYICLSCSCEEMDWREPSCFAQLVDGQVDQLYCPVCAATYTVLRERCGEAGCRCDVLSTDTYRWGTCLRCARQSDARAETGRAKLDAALDAPITVQAVVREDGS